MLTDYAEARRLVVAQRRDWGRQTVPLADAGGRVLAEPLLTDRPQPPFDRVTMDGVAFDYAAYAAGQRQFSVAAVVAAGSVPPPLPDPAVCLEVMTGAVLPPGCTTVVRYEDIQRRGADVRLPDGLADGKNIHGAGSDAAAGQVLAPAGTLIGSGTVNLLATCGYAMVTVSRAPRTAVVATGDELVAVDATPQPHQIRMSNLYQLRYLLTTAGVTADLHHLRDDPAELRSRIAALLDDYDLLLFSGGVSKGKYDYLPSVLAELGVDTIFHRVAQRPGKPLYFGTRGATLVFGLPGNPVSGLAGTLAYVGPLLRASYGMTDTGVTRELAADLTFRPPLTLFQLCRIDPRTQAAHPLTGQGSGDATSMLRADGMLVLPTGRERFAAGERFAWLGAGGLL